MKHTLLLLFLTFGAIYAQDDSINKLEEIVLQGNFSPVLNSGFQIQVITDSVLSNQYESLGNLLQQQANLYFKQNGYGMVSSISLRGTSASQTGVYWNGISINSALNGQTDFNTLQANGFDELELRKGGGSVLLGNGSVGGAINLKDKATFQKQKEASLLLGGGSYDTYFTQLKGVWSNEKFYAKVSGGAQSSANDYPYLGTDLKNENAAFSNINLNTNLAYKISNFHSLGLHASVFDNDRELSRTLSAESEGQLKNSDARLLLDWKFLGNRFTSSLKTAYLYEDFQYLFDKQIAENESYGESNRFIGKYDFSYFLSNHLFFRAGLEYEHAKGSGTNFSNANQDDFTAYFLMHHEPTDRFLYNVSFRAGVSSAYDIPFIYSLDAKYLLTNAFSARGAFSTNYRLPTFNDLYWEPGGNPDLKPEFSYSGELGIRYNFKSFNLDAGTYFIKSSDMIQWRPVTFEYWRPENVSEVLNYGLEVAGDYSYSVGDHMFDLRASYDYNLATDEATDKQLIYVPKHRAAAIFDYGYHKWQFTYHLRYVGEVYTTTSNTQSLDAYWLSDISFSRNLFKQHLGISFKVNNLFNVKYESVAFRPMPNRNYLVQINLNI